MVKLPCWSVNLRELVNFEKVSEIASKSNE